MGDGASTSEIFTLSSVLFEQFELRERQKEQNPDSADAAQRRRPNYVEYYKEQFLPPPEPV